MTKEEYKAELEICLKKIYLRLSANDYADYEHKDADIAFAMYMEQELRDIEDPNYKISVID